MTGRRHPSIRQLLAGLLIAVVALAALLSIVTVLQMRTANERTQAERQRVTSFRLADQMRQSSNDLTRMVRLYVVTGDRLYRRSYDRILEIRRGVAPRPRDYDSSFWDRVLAAPDAPIATGPPASLTELMRRAEFAPDEFAALDASLRSSNRLAVLEVQVMDRVEPRIAQGVGRSYLRDVAPAHDRLVDDGYHVEKRRIMAAVDRFTALVDRRTASRAASLQARTEQLLIAQTLVLVLLVSGLLVALAIAARAIVRPLSRLADVTRLITRGDWSQRARPEGVRELTQLADDFNEMTDAVQRDLAGRRQAEHEAREASERLQTIADRVPGAVFQFHVDSVGALSVRFASRNGSVHRADDSQDVDFPGMSRSVVPDDRGGWLDSMLAAAGAGGPWHREYRITTATGETAWMEGQALALPNPDGSAELYGYVADVTDRKVLEAELTRAREEAEAADRAKSAFLAMMSHELRTPLVAVTGTLEILSLDDLDSRQRDLVDLAMGSARSLLAVIGDVLDFSKIEAGFLDLSSAPVATGPLVADVAAQYRHAAAVRGLALHADVEPRVAGAHVVDAARLRQVLGNLVSNALKFTREGAVTLSVTVAEDLPGSQRLVFAVRDTGIGISESDQRRLFRPFTQASTDSARSSEGAGLGLTICRQLARAMGGDVQLESVPGAGTTVRVALELETADPPAAGAARAGLRRGSGGRLAPPDRATAERRGALVLLVEDNPVNRQVLQGQLEAVGYRVDAAADADEALDRFQTTLYGIVFTDIQLPLVDGYELARRLRIAEHDAGRPRTPVLALTASALEGERERCRAAGMDDVVTKPTTMDVLAATLGRWLPASVQPEPEPSTGTIGSAALDELTAGDAQLAARILESYAASACDDLTGIDAALAVGDRERVGRGAHQLLGASRMVGAWTVADRAERLQAAAEAGRAPAVLTDLLDALRETLAAVAGQIASSRSASAGVSAAVAPSCTTEPASSTT